MTSHPFLRWRPQRGNFASDLSFWWLHSIRKVEVYLQTKFRRDISIHGWDTAWFVQSASDAVDSDCPSSFSESVLGMRVSWSKTKLQNLGSGNKLPTISMPNGNTVESVDNFVYLGSLQSSDAYCRPDIKRRIGLASSVMTLSSLRTIWTDKCLSISTKLRVYQTFVLSVLLYASETWTVLATDTSNLESFHMKWEAYSWNRMAWSYP